MIFHELNNRASVSSFSFVVGSRATRSSVHTFETTDENTVQIGKGNLKLTFSSDQGKRRNYVNSRTSVCSCVITIVVLGGYTFPITAPH